MKKGLLLLKLLTLSFFTFSVTAFSATIYLPTSSSSEYLPTVKVVAYALNYDGSLAMEGYGSGTLIDGSGTILTNNHVVEQVYDANQVYPVFQICLTKSDNPDDPICEFTASFIDRDPAKDVALLRMDSTDVNGANVDFDFYLPYENTAVNEIGDKITAIGYPDIGGKTITYTSGSVSGFVNEYGVSYMKTDADISFGNSGGTAVDAEGNFIGVPTYIVGSYSTEVLGYLLPVKEVTSWIKQHLGQKPVVNAAAKERLVADVKKFLNANKTGVYVNQYPAFSISALEGWEFSDVFEDALSGGMFGMYLGGDVVTLYPKDDRNGQVYVQVFVSDYAYNVTLDDLEFILNSGTSGDIAGYDFEVSREKLNGKYEAVKSVATSADWWSGNGGNFYTVTYYVPYGDDVVNVVYNYTDAELLDGGIDDIGDVVASFELDMSKVKSSVVDKVESTNPMVSISNPLENGFLSDDSYDFDGKHYFGAIFGKKRDLNFYVSVYSALYTEFDLEGNFADFKANILSDREEFSQILAKGDVTIDGHKGFFFTEEFDYDYGPSTYSTTVYIDNGTGYLSAYYSASDESYGKGMLDFQAILRAIEFEKKGAGRYFLPKSFAKSVNAKLSDIKNHVYESAIKDLDKHAVFEVTPASFFPESDLSRQDFVVWTVKYFVGSLGGELAADFEDFKAGFTACSEKCFKDFDYTSANAVYVAFAQNKGAIGTSAAADGSYYFKPADRMSLAGALKVMFELGSYEVWDAPSFIPWYMPYIQLAYKLEVMPYGVDSVDHLLKRGEGAYMLNALFGTKSYF